jgi:2-polyprenyl-6-methoxyphenol hydroxylase-like FAD-dependent oxidoreductase
VDVLIVGAGPTGLALATQLQRFGTSFRIIDRSVDRTRESRALAVQARTLEILDTVGLADPLVSLGRTGTRVVVHVGTRIIAQAPLGGSGASDTRYPFVLFVSQMETERLLDAHLSRAGISVERGVELAGLTPNATSVDCLLRHHDGRTERVRPAYVVGCDGAHSSVRRMAAFTFAGGTYPQDFMLGDVEADGPLAAGAVNAFAGAGGVALFFPLGAPRSWRVIAMRTSRQRRRPHDEHAEDEAPAPSLTLEELQDVVAAPAQGTITVRDPAWLTHFRLHHRQTAHYRRGRVFVAGDAAHIHSPVGGQGMNTGIQDAWNLGWKLALVARGADERLLETYEAERWPVGRFLLRYTDRIFSAFTRAMSGGPVATWAREVIAPRLVPRVAGNGWLGPVVFRFVSELGIRYRGSPAVREGAPRLTRGPRAGDRLPDGRLTIGGSEVFLQRVVAGPCFTLLLCTRDEPDPRALSTARELTARYNGLVEMRVVSAGAGEDVLADNEGAVLDVLGVKSTAQYLIRPDGYVAFRCRGWDMRELAAFLGEWLEPSRQRWA